MLFFVMALTNNIARRGPFQKTFGLFCDIDKSSHSFVICRLQIINAKILASNIARETIGDQAMVRKTKGDL